MAVRNMCFECVKCVKQKEEAAGWTSAVGREKQEEAHVPALERSPGEFSTNCLPRLARTVYNTQPPAYHMHTFWLEREPSLVVGSQYEAVMQLKLDVKT